MKKKFWFLTTLRHPANAKDPEKIVELLNLTIRTILDQDYPDVALMIVCNEKPDGVLENELIQYHIVDFPIPGAGKSSGLALSDMHRDKGLKIASGLAALQEHQPRFVYVIDSDDWLHKNVARYVMEHSHQPFWYVDKGFLVDYKNELMIRKSGLCRYCGSSFIYDYQLLFDILNLRSITPKSTHTEILDKIGQYEIINFLGNHRFQFSFLRGRGYEIKAIPFRSMCWIVNTGENHSATTTNGVGIPFSKNFTNSFSVANSTSEKATIKAWMEEKKLSFSSFMGWTFTNKKQEKV